MDDSPAVDSPAAGGMDLDDAAMKADVPSSIIWEQEGEHIELHSNDKVKVPFRIDDGTKRWYVGEINIIDENSFNISFNDGDIIEVHDNDWILYRDGEEIQEIDVKEIKMHKQA